MKKFAYFLRSACDFNGYMVTMIGLYLLLSVFQLKGSLTFLKTRFFFFPTFGSKNKFSPFFDTQNVSFD